MFEEYAIDLHRIFDDHIELCLVPYCKYQESDFGFNPKHKLIRVLLFPKYIKDRSECITLSMHFIEAGEDEIVANASWTSRNTAHKTKSNNPGILLSHMRAIALILILHGYQVYIPRLKPKKDEQIYASQKDTHLVEFKCNRDIKSESLEICGDEDMQKIMEIAQNDDIVNKRKRKTINENSHESEVIDWDMDITNKSEEENSFWLDMCGVS